MVMTTPKVYTVDEVAAILKVRPRTVYELVKDGKIRAVKIGERQMRISEEALTAYLRGETPASEH